MKDVQAAKYFSIISDSTPDISYKDQLSQVLRYVSIKGKKVEIKESFIDFIETDGKNAEEVTNLILLKLENDGIDIPNCRGQSYDNASVMTGKNSGVQTRIRAINEKADFVPCGNHTLNLVGVHSASAAVNYPSLFLHVYAFFSSSTHTWNVLLSAVIKISVKRVSETRWSARCDAVKALKSGFTEILNILEELDLLQEMRISTLEQTLVSCFLLCSLFRFCLSFTYGTKS